MTGAEQETTGRDQDNRSNDVRSEVGAPQNGRDLVVLRRWSFHHHGDTGATGLARQVRSRHDVVIGVPGSEIEATAREVHDHEFRRGVFTHRDIRWYSNQAELDRLVRPRR